MDSIQFDINNALKLYMSDPATIPTPEADTTLADCESDPEALGDNGLINSVLNTIVDAVAEHPEAITRSSTFDSLQFLLKCATVLLTTDLRSMHRFEYGHLTKHLNVGMRLSSPRIRCPRSSTPSPRGSQRKPMRYTTTSSSTNRRASRITGLCLRSTPFCFTGPSLSSRLKPPRSHHLHQPCADAESQRARRPTSPARMVCGTRQRSCKRRSTRCARYCGSSWAKSS
jgi:hypothetical protein